MGPQLRPLLMFLSASLYLFPFLAMEYGHSKLLVVLLAILASLKINIRFNLTVLQRVMGFYEITIAREIRINSFRVGLDITLFSNHVIKLAPTHELVSIADGSKGHSHNIDNLISAFKEIHAIVSLHVVIQDTVIKLSIVGAHSNFSIVTNTNVIKIDANVPQRCNVERVKCNTIHVKISLVLHKTITTNKDRCKRRVHDLTHEVITLFKRVTLAVLDNPCNIKGETGIGDSLNVKNSENLTHGGPPRLVVGVPFGQLLYYACLLLESSENFKMCRNCEG